MKLLDVSQWKQIHKPQQKSRSVFHSRSKVKFAVLRPSVQQVILLSPPFRQIDTFLSPSRGESFSFTVWCTDVPHVTTTSIRLASSFRIFQFFHSPSTHDVLRPLLLLDAEATSFLLLCNLTTCFSRTRFSDQSTGMCRACAKCYRAQLVLRVRQERAPSPFSLAPSMLTLLPLPASWLSAYFPSSFRFPCSFYRVCIFFHSTVRSSCCACATKYPYSPPFSSFSVSEIFHLAPTNSYHASSTISILFLVRCPYSSDFFLPNNFFFVCYTVSSSCRAYATIKHLLSVFF